MQATFAERYHDLEEQHWWFVARREILLALLQRACVGPDADILEVGCSGGSLMLALREAGYVNVRGIDVSEPAVALARSRGVERVEAMDGAALTFADESFDVVLASDVLGHIEDEGEALQSWRRVLKPWGRLIVFVPAFNPLRSEHDIPNEHFRRYTAQRLVAALWQQGFMTERAAYWNIALLAPVAVARLLRRALPRRMRTERQLAGAGPVAQRALLGLLRAENRLITAGVNFPAGISVFALARSLNSKRATSGVWAAPNAKGRNGRVGFGARSRAA
jgi:SAM-dependent methyltransferase